MDRRRFLAGLGISLTTVPLLTAGCGGGDGGNIPEEKVITKEASEDMARSLKEGMKGLNDASKKKK